MGTYDETFKRTSVARLGEPGMTLAQLSRETGVHRTTLSRWVAAFGAPKTSSVTSSAQEAPDVASNDASNTTHDASPVASPHPTRNGNGTFKKGHSGNPGGSSSARERAQRLAEEASVKIIKKMIKRLKKMPNCIDPCERDAEKVRQSLELALLDRGMGKATQRQEVTGKDGGPVEVLDAAGPPEPPSDMGAWLKRFNDAGQRLGLHDEEPDGASEAQ